MLKKQHENLHYIKIDFSVKNGLKQILDYCFHEKLISIIVEGGAATLNTFIKHALWDEARILTNKNMEIRKGIAAPVIKGRIISSIDLKNDFIQVIKPH